jgi:hypothetical protein
MSQMWVNPDFCQKVNSSSGTVASVTGRFRRVVNSRNQQRVLIW